jgi:hypothetical protein
MSDSLISSDPAPADTSPADTTPAPADFAFYQDGALSEQFSTMLGDNKSAKSHFEKYAKAENPFEASMNGIKDLNYLAGQKERTRPADDATDEEKATWNAYIKQQNGVPDDAKGYGWERPEDVSEDMWDQAQIDGFAEILHKGNVPPETAKELFDAYNDSLRGAPEQMQAQIDAQLAVERDILNAEFGMETEKMLAKAPQTGNMWGLSEQETARICSTAEGVKLMERMSNAVTSDVTSNTQSSNGISQGGNSNYEEQAMASGMKAIEAHNRGDMASYRKFSEQQSHFNQLHANAS